ncbi:nucleotidyltransferase domain-containing protein [Fredinandcohnia sp. QZ13]|uniref:nucleotidyltransferase domain-containing protein n=1 Tax=Fredinandcohnia sp. QZ13 TaxID=3073144 RepID=UPI00285328AF|nr:nucleotidyltransferase domain-containing protein [Fredinandcohnia sp. QZ13]MDR4886183.1 nucleotidyltransferase domain-containing protein [Fredinandcohnia sp. QZ13]
MKEHIIEVLKQIEKEYEVKILYACEVGSRTWSVSSELSDYDVRFIYIHKIDWYLSIDQKRDVLEIPKHQKVNIPLDPLVDMSGWELTKALRLFRKSNPGLLEWLHSNIIYTQTYSFVEKMKQLEPIIFSPNACIYHYVKMAKGNFKTIQEKGPNIKTYMNVIRPLLMAKYIQKYNRMGNLDMNSLINELLPNGVLKTNIENIMKLKSKGENVKNQNLLIDTFIDEQFTDLKHYVSKHKHTIPNPTPQLNQLFREILSKAWDN